MPTYLSAEALAEMKEQIVYRKTKLRREIAEHISAAKEFGDLSENFEYQDAKEEQGLNEAKISELEAHVHDVIVVTTSVGASEIGLGTSFTVKSVMGEKTFTLVGSNEASPLTGKISNESPMGIAFIGRKVGEEIHVSTPAGSTTYQIVSIE